MPRHPQQITIYTRSEMFRRARPNLLLTTTMTTMFVAGSLTQTHRCQAASWANPVNGFYETTTNWTPVGVPTAGDSVIFDLADDYAIGFQGNHAATNLTVTNGADIQFIVAGVDTSNRVYRINGNAFLLNSELEILGNDAGPRMSLVLTDDLDIRGNTNALRVVDNAGILNTSSFVDLNGIVSVDGTNASWNMSEELTLRGDALLRVENGGIASAGETVTLGGSSSNDESNGFLTVRGVGNDGQPSTFIGQDDLFVGSYGIGRVNIEDGAFMDIATRVRVGFGAGGGGTIIVAGTDANGNPSTLNTGLITQGTVTPGGMFIRDGGLVRSDSATVGDSSSADVEIDGLNGPSAWEISGGLIIGATGSGRVEAINGARLEAAETFLGLSSTPGRLFVTGNSVGQQRTTTWENSGDVYVGGNATLDLGVASLLVQGNARGDVGGTVRIWSAGIVSVNEGARLAADTIDNSHGGEFRFSEGGILHVNRFEGSLLNASGTLAPGVDGAAAATLITGDYTQQSNATLSLGIGGFSPGGTHDLVNIIGAADIDGDLELSLIDGFIPDPTDEFTVFAANSLIGFFDNVATGQRLDTTDGFGSFVVNYGIGSAFDPTRIVLSNFEASATIPGDFNTDGDVDGDDFLAWQRNPSIHNFTHWQSNYGTTSPLTALKATQPVPEPCTLGLMLLAGTIASWRGKV